MLLDSCQVLIFNQYGDDKGNLVVIEGKKSIPFDIKRIFYIYGTSGNSVRGKHANKKSEFVLINVAGTCKVKVTDGERQKEFVLDVPNKGVYIPKLLWKDMYDFTDDAVLLCLSNENYDAEEYIRDYDEYVMLMNGYGC